MAVVISVISDVSRLLEIEETWNQFIHEYTENPFLLVGFLRQSIEFNGPRGWRPLLLVVSDNDTVVGLAPLMIRTRFGIRYARFLLTSAFSPDLIIRHGYEEICMAHILDFLFGRARCHILDLVFPAQSSHPRIMGHSCNQMGVHLYYQEGMRHCILPVLQTWDDFAKSRGSEFRHDIRRTERDLGRTGSWRILCIDDPDHASEAFREIMHVEHVSWKETRRARTHHELDEDLLMIWNGLQCPSARDWGLKWVVWLLQICDRTIAYVLVLLYKEVAYLIKTSYDRRRKRLSPGIYVLNAIIRDLLEKEVVARIDFLTDLPFMHTWTHVYSRRVRVTIPRRGILARTVVFFIGSPYARRIRHIILRIPLLTWIAPAGGL